MAHSVERLKEVELLPFQAAVDAEVAAVMVAHVTVPALDQLGACLHLTSPTGTLPNIRNTLNKKSTRHSGPRIAANSVE